MVFLLKDKPEGGREIEKTKERKPLLLKDYTILSLHTLKIIGIISSNYFSIELYWNK